MLIEEWAETQTDMKKPIFPFQNFTDTPNKAFIFDQIRVPRRG
jgi:hypothetical protein